MKMTAENSRSRKRGGGLLCWWWAAKMKFGGLENCQITCFENTNPDIKPAVMKSMLHATPSFKKFIFDLTVLREQPVKVKGRAC